MSITAAKVRTPLMRLCAALVARRPSASHSRRTASLAGFFTHQRPRRDFLSGDQGTGNSVAGAAFRTWDRNLPRSCEFTVRGLRASRGCEACHDPTLNGQRFSYSCHYERHFPDGGRTVRFGRDILNDPARGTIADAVPGCDVPSQELLSGNFGHLFELWSRCSKPRNRHVVSGVPFGEWAHLRGHRFDLRG